jgi:F-type H+-transporting ATPase subunit b
MISIAHAAETAGEAGAAHTAAFYEEPVFWVAVAFFIFLGVAIRYVWPPLRGMLDSRTENVRKELDEAQRLREEAQHLLAEYQRKQRDAAKQTEEMLEQARKDAVSQQEEAQAQLERALKSRERQVQDRIAQAEAQALAEVRNAAVDVAVAATREVLKDRLGEARIGKLVDEAIGEIPKKLH